MSFPSAPLSLPIFVGRKGFDSGVIPNPTAYIDGFESSANYAPGPLVVHPSILYRCTT